MNEIRHQVGIAASVDEVHKALVTARGISGWWTHCSGDFEVGGTIVFDFIIMQMPMRIIEMGESRIVWQVLEGDEQWRDTEIVFELEPRKDQVMVNFRHQGWRELTELFDHCSTKWAVFMLSLKDYVETGSGQPVPDDTQINHY